MSNKNRNILNALALKANILEDVEESMVTKMGVDRSDINRLGYISILFDKNKTIIDASSNLSKNDTNTIKDWAKTMRAGKIADKIYHLKMTTGLFIFKKFAAQGNKNYDIIVGGIIEYNQKTNITTTLMQSTQTFKELTTCLT